MRTKIGFGLELAAVILFFGFAFTNPSMQTRRAEIQKEQKIETYKTARAIARGEGNTSEEKIRSIEENLEKAPKIGQYH